MKLHPILVMADFSFQLDHRTLSFHERPISASGVTGLPWNPLRPEEHFGMLCTVELQTKTSPSMTFRIRANLSREINPQGRFLGLNFLMDPAQKSQLEELIHKQGFFPPHYNRKLPRIPSLTNLQTFPLHAFVSRGPVQIVLDIADLSPGGALFRTQNQVASGIQLGDTLEVVLEPRGWFPSAVRVEGTIQRILDSLDPDSGNIIRSLGMKFTNLDETNKAAFLDLLKGILIQLKDDA